MGFNSVEFFVHPGNQAQVFPLIRTELTGSKQNINVGVFGGFIPQGGPKQDYLIKMNILKTALGHKLFHHIYGSIPVKHWNKVLASEIIF